MPIKTPVCDQFGIEKPIFLAGMGGVAYADICAAVSEAGVEGSDPAAERAVDHELVVQVDGHPLADHEHAERVPLERRLVGRWRSRAP